MSQQSNHLDRARALVPVLAERAAATEARRQLPAETIADLRSSGLARMSQQRRYGGAELPIHEIADAIAMLARGCASAAWCCALFNDHWILLSKLPPQAAEDVLHANSEALISAGFFPFGNAARVAGGFRIAGTWNWASGCDHADWLFLGNLVPLDDGPPTPCLCLVPRSAVEIEDNWHVLGLCGTGSKNIIVKDAIVPPHRVLPMPVSANGIPPGRTDLAPLHRLPHVSTAPFLFVSTGLGIAEDLLERMISSIKVQNSRGQALAELQSMQLHIAESAAEIDAARLVLQRDLSEAMAAMHAGRVLTIEERARNRRDQAYVGQLCRRAVDRLFATAGSRGIFDNQVAQRKFRDMCVASTHISMGWDMAGTAYGRVRLGLDPATFLL